MEHNKLLTMIEDKFNNHSGMHDAQIVNALYRVVELHKPTEAWGDTHCGFCFDLAWEPSGLEMMDKHFAYPCPTIEAIQKELI